LIGVLPTYAQVGVLAPILLVLIRLLQGLSVGGEFSSSATYLVETAPMGKRGLTGSWANIGSMTGSLLGVGAAALVTNIFDAETLGDWAWRLPFLGGALLGMLAILMRRNLHTSERFEQHDTAREPTSPLMQAFTVNLKETLLALAFAASYGTCFYLCFVYLPEWLAGQALMDRSTALVINTAMTVLVIPLMPFMAIVGDRVLARRTWIGLALLGLGLFGWPLHAWMMASGGSLFSVIVFHLVAFTLLSVPLGSAPALFVEMFPEADRLSGYSVAFNLGMGVFGGLTPMIATGLIASTGFVTAPALYMTAACGFAVICLAFVADNSRGPLR
jgi:MHS family proline/betaine transporter-like MFS transporter